MMKLYFLLISICPLVLFAQEEFSFELYFEDALGNKDTLILGYDPNATDSIDTAFGEVNILNQPWDNVFEVRTGEAKPNWSSSSSAYESKKQVIDKTCIFDFDIFINMVAVNYPVVIRWDTTLFVNDSCRLASILSGVNYPQTDVFEAPSIYLSNRYRTLGDNADSLIIDPSQWNQSLNTYNNGSVDLSVLWLSFANPEEVSASIKESSSTGYFHLFPNPGSGIINIDFIRRDKEGILIKVFDLSGSLILTKPLIYSNELDLSHLENGTYILTIKCEDSYVSERVVIQK